MKKYNNGKLKDIPDEIVEKMLDNQVNQGNKRDHTVFESNLSAAIIPAGFIWNRSIEEKSGIVDFWHKIIDNKNFDIFYEFYPEYKIKSSSSSSSLNRPNFANVEETIAWLDANYPIDTEFISPYSGDKGTRKGPITFFEKGKYVAAINTKGDSKYFIIHDNKLTPTTPLCDIKVSSSVNTPIGYPNLSNESETIKWLKKSYPKNSYQSNNGGNIIWKGKFTETPPVQDLYNVSIDPYKTEPITKGSDNPYDYFYVKGSDDLNIRKEYQKFFDALNVNHRASFLSSHWYWVVKKGSSFEMDCTSSLSEANKIGLTKKLMTLEELKRMYPDALSKSTITPEPTKCNIPWKIQGLTTPDFIKRMQNLSFKTSLNAALYFTGSGYYWLEQNKRIRYSGIGEKGDFMAAPTKTIDELEEMYGIVYNDVVKASCPYNVDEYVILKRGNNWCYLMDYLIGQCVQIKSIEPGTKPNNFRIQFKESSTFGWYINEDAIERIATTIEILNAKHIGLSGSLLATTEPIKSSLSTTLLPTKTIKIFDRD